MTVKEMLADLTEALVSRNAVHGVTMDEKTVKDYVAHLAQPFVELCTFESRDSIAAAFKATRAAINKLEAARDAAKAEAAWSPAQAVGL